MKQEAIEDAIRSYIYETYDTEPLWELLEDVAKVGARWQQKRSYSKGDMLQSFLAGIKCESKNGKNFEQFIKQFKKKDYDNRTI